VKKLTMRCALSVLFLLLVFLPAQTFAQNPQSTSGGTSAGLVTLDFKDVELADLIHTISELTGKNFLFDETVKGRVTIVSPDSMTLNEAYELFLSVLNVKGYTVVPSGKMNKIVPLKSAKESSLPTVTGAWGRSTEQVITRVFRLKHLDAAVVAPTVLIPLVPSTSNVSAYGPSNSLIITDTSANIDRLAKIIFELDQPDSEGSIEIVPVLNASVEDLAKILNEIMIQPQAAVATRRRTAAAGGGNTVATKIIPYAAGRSLIVMATTDDLEYIKGLITRMDQKGDGASSNVNLYYLENADAVSLAATLNEILTGIKAEARVATAQGQAPGSLSTGPVSITADKPTNSLVINASPDNYRMIKEIIEKLDIKRKQVYVEALILELSMEATQRLGVSLQGGGAVKDGFAFGSSNQREITTTDGIPDLLTTAVSGLLAGGFFNPIRVNGPDGTPITVPALSVLIDLSKTDSDVNLLSAPRLLTSDNEEAEIIVGSNVPIITGRLTDATGGQNVAVERQDVALILRFTPQITEGDLVRLNVYQEITNIASATENSRASVGSASDVGPIFTKRVLRNTVLVENRKTVVLGGLIDTNVIESVAKVPILGDIPLLGWLFKRTSTQEKKTNLLVFINPTIIKNAEDMDRVTGRNRQAASALLTEKVQSALPENFFGEATGVPEILTPQIKPGN